MSVSRPHGRKCQCHSLIETTATPRSRRRTPQRPGCDNTRPARGASRPSRDKVRPAEARQRRFREKTRPASAKTPILERFERAGRTFSRVRRKHAEQGELYRAQTAANTQRRNQQHLSRHKQRQRGNYPTRGSDTPITRHQGASCRANPHCHTASKPTGWHTPPNWIGNSNLDRLLRSG